VACVLYSLAFISLGGRPVLLQLKPQNKTQVFNIVVMAVVIGFICYALLMSILVLSGIDMVM
jgi:hypothetical protein